MASSRNFHENKKASTRNPIAKALKNPSLKQQVVPSKKRKIKDKFRKAEALDAEIERKDK